MPENYMTGCLFWVGASGPYELCNRFSHKKKVRPVDAITMTDGGQVFLIAKC